MRSELHRQQFSCFFEDKFPHSIHIFICSAHQWTSHVQNLLHCFWTSKTTQKPLFFQLPVLQIVPPTFWKFLYYFYQFQPKFNAGMLSRYNEIAKGTTHVCIQTDITTVQSHTSQPHSKQAVAQQPQHHLHWMVTVCASSSNSVYFSQGLLTLLVLTEQLLIKQDTHVLAKASHKSNHTIGTEPPQSPDLWMMNLKSY